MNARCIHRLGGLVHAPPGDHAISGDFSQRNQHESTLEQARVRQCQVGLVQNQVIIGKNVEVGGTRAVALFMGTVTTKPQFDLLSPRQQLMRAQCGFDCDGNVDEVRLIFEAPRRRLIVG